MVIRLEMLNLEKAQTHMSTDNGDWLLYDDIIL